jgi:prophage tail gpP-like protein
MRYAFGRATLADIEVQGWRQPDGTLWVVNQMVPVQCAPLEINADMLIAGVNYAYDAIRGKICRLTVGPPEGYTPDPGEVRLRKHGKGHGGSWNLDGLGSANE